MTVIVGVMIVILLTIQVAVLVGHAYVRLSGKRTSSGCACPISADMSSGKRLGSRDHSLNSLGEFFVAVSLTWQTCPHGAIAALFLEWLKSEMIDARSG